MSFCYHCEGQRFDRARVLRALRATRQQVRQSDADGSATLALALGIEAVRALDVPHLDAEDDWTEDEVVH